MAQHQGVVWGLTPSCGESVTPDCGLLDHWPERIHSVCCTDVQGLFRRRLIHGMAQHHCVVGGVTPSCGEGVTPDCSLGARCSKMSPWNCFLVLTSFVEIYRETPLSSVLHQYVEGSFWRCLIHGMAQHQGVVGGLTPSCGEGITPDCGVGARFNRVHSYNYCLIDVIGLHFFEMLVFILSSAHFACLCMLFYWHVIHCDKYFLKRTCVALIPDWMGARGPLVWVCSLWPQCHGFKSSFWQYVVALGKPLLPIIAHAWLPLTSPNGINLQINDRLAFCKYCHLQRELK